MEFRKKQIETFIEETRKIAKTIGMVPSPRTGNMVDEDEYISGIIGEVEERLIDLSSARITILNYLNQQVDSGNGEAFNRMREEFLKINLWVRGIEIEVLGKPAVDETSINPDTDKPIVNPLELQEVAQQYFPPGFRAFTGAEEAAIKAMQEKVEAEVVDTSEDYDPYHKTTEQSEELWEERFNAKEDEANIYMLASHIASNNNLFNYDLLSLLNIGIYQKRVELINERFVRRINELAEEDQVTDMDACSLRMAAIVLATNLFTKEFETFEVDFGTRKKLGVTVEAAGSNLTFKPASMAECVQFIFMKMGALRPLKDEEIEILAKFIKLNKDKEEDIKYMHGVIDGMAHLYVFSGFVDTARRLAEAMASDRVEEVVVEEPTATTEDPEVHQEPTA
jgi:hypothetical protein